MPAKPLTDDRLYCRGILRSASRTFALNIPLLDANLKWPVLASYLLCRIIDTVEDCEGLLPHEKSSLLKRFVYFLENEDPNRLQKWADDFFKLKPQIDPKHLELVKHSHQVLSVFYSLPSEQQRVCAEPIKEMAQGMVVFIEKEDGGQKAASINSMQELDQYCYYVAGTVGHLLTQLFALEKKRETEKTNLKQMGEDFGKGLQLVNILKDQGVDQLRDISFLPVTQFSGDEARCLQEVRTLCHNKLLAALDYTDQWQDYRRIHLFCLWPLTLAISTLELLNFQEISGHKSLKISKSKLYLELLRITFLAFAKPLWAAAFLRRRLQRLQHDLQEQTKQRSGQWQPAQE